MKDGLLPVVAVTGGIAAVLVWSMSAHDPYWRLFETPSVPAPIYDRPEDLRAVLASVTQDYGNGDSGAMSPAADPLASAQRTNIPLDTIAREAATAAIPEPMIALVALPGPEPMTGPAIDKLAAYRLPFAATPEPAGLAPDTLAPDNVDTGMDIVVAFAPTPVPVALRLPGAGAVAQAVPVYALNPFSAPAAPALPRIVATEVTEDALALERAGRIDVQRRLALAGFDPSGIDGTFGLRTRGAITDFQAAWGFPATGYLEAAVYAELNQRTEDAYQALRRQAAAAPSAAPKLAPMARERKLTSAEGGNRCTRRSDGRIVENQSFGCDLVSFTEQFVTLGRNILNGEYGDLTENAAHTPLAPGSGADR